MLAAIAIFSMEYVVNLVNPEMGTYERWLAEHNGAGPLYPCE